MFGGIANKTSRIDKRNRSAQLTIADTVRHHMIEEYGYHGDHSRSKVSTWMCIAIVASISVIVRSCCCPMSSHSVEQMLATAQLRAAGEAWPARPASRPHQRSGPGSDAASTANDRLAKMSAGARCGTPPSEQRRGPTLGLAWLRPQPTAPARSVLRCTLSSTASREGQSEAVSVCSCTDGTQLFSARVEGDHSVAWPEAVVSLETVRGEDQIGPLSTKEAEGPDPKMEMTKACETKLGSPKANENVGRVTARETGAALLPLCHQARDLRVHHSGGHHHSHGVHVQDSSGAALAEVKLGSNKGAYEVRVCSGEDAGPIILGLF